MVRKFRGEQTCTVSATHILNKKLSVTVGLCVYLEVVGHVLRQDVDHPQAVVETFLSLLVQGGRVRPGGGDENSLLSAQPKASARDLVNTRRLLGREPLLLRS